MSKPLALVVLTLFLSCAGCFTPAPEKIVVQPPMPVAPTPPPVTAAQVNRENAHQIAKRVREEIDRDLQQTTVADRPKDEK